MINGEKPSVVVFLFQCKINTGYAIEKLEFIFRESAKKKYGEDVNILFTFSECDEMEVLDYKERTGTECMSLSLKKMSPKQLEELKIYLAQFHVRVVVGFDTQPQHWSHRFFRSIGAAKIVSYWGAPMSSLNSGVSLLLKKLEVLSYRHQPDCYVFESSEMADTALNGRGVVGSRVAVCNLGVDTVRYKYKPEFQNYAADQFGIEHGKKILYFSGHMEHRKGVWLLLEAISILKSQGRDDFHLLIFGNKGNEAEYFGKWMLAGDLEAVVTFGGYRLDLDRILSSVYLGVIPSTGWDSFTMSSIEIMSSSVPLIASDLQGLKEAVVPAVNGFSFSSGNAEALANHIALLLENESLRDYLGFNARASVENRYSLETNINRLAKLI